MNQNIGFELYNALFHADKSPSAIKAWALIEDAMKDIHNQAINSAMRAAVDWTSGKERGDYDTFSAASAISSAISELRVSL